MGVSWSLLVDTMQYGAVILNTFVTFKACVDISSDNGLALSERSHLLNQAWPNHDDVIKWKHFPRYWPFVRGIHRSPVNSPHKGKWRRVLMLSLICDWINGWINTREAGDLRRHCAPYDVTVMFCDIIWRHAMETFSAFLALCEGNHQSPVELLTQDQ